MVLATKVGQARLPKRMQANWTPKQQHNEALQRYVLTSSFMDLSPLEPPPLEKVKMRGWVVAMASGCLKVACSMQHPGHSVLQDGLIRAATCVCKATFPERAALCKTRCFGRSQIAGGSSARGCSRRACLLTGKSRKG